MNEVDFGLAELTRKAQERRWTKEERDRFFVLIRRRYPGIRFVPSSAEFARRFGHLGRIK